MSRRYKYVLLSNNTSERLELRYAPVGWDRQKLNIIRDMTYFGVLKSLSVELEFVGDAYDFLVAHKRNYGVDANVIIRLYRGNKFFFEGKINFPNYQNFRDNNRFVVDIIQSSFVQKFQTRDDVKLNMRNNVSLDRNAINPVAFKPATIRGKTVYQYAEFVGASTIDEVPSVFNEIVPFILRKGTTDVKEVSAIETNGVIDDLYTSDNAFYHNTTSQEQTVALSWVINYTLSYQGQPASFPLDGVGPQFVRIKIRLMLRDEDNNLDDMVYERVLNGTFGNKQDAFTGDIVVPSGSYLIFTCERYTTDDVPMSNFEMLDGRRTEIQFNSASMTLSIASIEADSVPKVILPHELFSNLVAQITGKNNAFESNLFGREDLGYDADGQAAYLAITTGDILRGLDPDNDSAEFQVITSFKDAFLSYSSIYNLGVLLTADGRIIIDLKDDLISNEIITNLGEVKGLKETPALNFLFNSVKVGFPPMEYEQENGRDEFNTEIQFTNSIESVKKELNLVSVYNGDGYGIEFARRLSLKIVGTTDTRYDGKIFFIDLYKQEDGSLVSRRMEGIDTLEGVFSPETVINARISPGQNMLRWSKYLAIPLHLKNSNVYYFQSKQKNSQLRVVTSLGESIDGQDLQLPSQRYFIPEFRTFESQITVENVNDIIANPLGLVQFTYKREKFYDLLFEVDAETEGANAKWKVLGTRPSPVVRNNDSTTNVSAIKYGNGVNDFIKYGNGQNDIIKYE